MSFSSIPTNYIKSTGIISFSMVLRSAFITFAIHSLLTMAAINKQAISGKPFDRKWLVSLLHINCKIIPQVQQWWSFIIQWMNTQFTTITWDHEFSSAKQYIRHFIYCVTNETMTSVCNYIIIVYTECHTSVL